MNQAFIFEVCAPNIQSALAAQEAGAQRIELCTALDIGGVTPSPGLIRAAVAALQIKVNVLIRPREGDFCYTDTELQVMLDDIRFCREAGVNGVVVGALNQNGQLDLPKLQAMREAAGDLEIVHHRAFDFCIDPFEALEQLIDLGYHRVLSSGLANSAYEGRFLLHKLIQHACGRISIMPGAGIDASNIQAISAATSAYEFHFTAKTKVDPSQGKAIRGLEASYWQSDAALIRATIVASELR